MKAVRDTQSILREAMELHRAGNAAQAEILYRAVLEVFPDEPNAWHLLGVVDWQAGKLDAGEEKLRKAISIQGTTASFHCNLGGLLKQKGLLKEAAASYKAALEFQTQYPDASNGLTDALGKYGLASASAFNWPEAEWAYRELIGINPLDAGAYNNLAQLLQHAGDPSAAIELYTRALSVKPDYKIARYNRAICRLGLNTLDGAFQDLSESVEAWVPLIDPRSDLPWRSTPLWDGSSLEGKSIVVWGDQGIGDEILFASMLPDLIARGAKVTVEADARLLALLERSFPSITVIARRRGPEAPADFDFKAPGLWLARHLRGEMGAFPNTNPYLKADPRLTAGLRRRYETLGRKRIIGLAWHSKTKGFGLARGIALRELAAFLPHQDVVYIDLQYGDTEDVRASVSSVFPHLLIHHDRFMDQMDDLDGFAAQTAACDQVVTIGNTTAHMAGALGVPAYVLIPEAGRTWYWFDEIDRSPWYPATTILRYKPNDGWSPALEAIRLALSASAPSESEPRAATKEVDTKALVERLQDQSSALMARFDTLAAKNIFRQILTLDGANVPVLNNLAMILQQEGDFSGARKIYDEALRSAPTFLPVVYNRSLCLLTEGDLPGGWAGFHASRDHWLRRLDDRKDLPWLTIPLWDGSDLKGKRLIVWGDAGVGDELLYASLLASTALQDADVTLECDHRLLQLFKKSLLHVNLLPRSDPASVSNTFDVQAPAMWLASLLRPDRSSFPPPKPFLKPDPAVKARYRTNFLSHGKKHVIGLSWYSTSRPWGQKRSVPLPDLLSALPLADSLIVDLQYGDAAEAWREAKRTFPGLTVERDASLDQFEDLDSFAAQIAACDYVVTIGNSTAHFAGAVGTPSFVLTSKEGLTWYWFANGASSPWYPKMTVLSSSEPDRLQRVASLIEKQDGK